MPPAIRWIFLTVSLLLAPVACVESNPTIRPVSKATTGGSGGAGKVTIGWNQVMADSYDLFMGTVPGGAEAGRKIANVANPFQITDLPIGATYYFVLSAKNDDRTRLQTRELAHQVQSPDDRITLAFPAQTNGITLAWDPTEEASSYNIYWRNAPGVTRQNGIKIPNVDTPHRLTGLIHGVTYYFVVTAVGKNGGESNVSEEISYQSKP
jgi:hypothetical protein